MAALGKNISSVDGVIRLKLDDKLCSYFFSDFMVKFLLWASCADATNGPPVSLFDGVAE